MNRLRIPPNRPVTLSLLDPEGEYDFDLNCGRYRTTGGEELILPRPAVIALNGLEPKPGEEIGIQHHVSGRKGEAPTWTVWLTPRSEQARAGEETLDEATEAQERAPRVSPARDTPRNAPEPATPIRKPVKRQLGTGTDGPAPEPVPVPLLAPTRQRPNVIPWNVAFREVSAWVAKELQGNSLQWSDEAQKSLCCTVLIAEVKAGRIGPWERPE